MKRLRVFLAITAISVLGFNTSAHAVPSFARQTGLACAACHTNYPELTQFGRVFKLNGYTLTGIKQIQAEPTTGAVGLKINEIPPLSAMLQISATAMKKQDPASQNGSVGFPQAASLFFAGEIAEHLGTFMQVTYTQDVGKFGAYALFANHYYAELTLYRSAHQGPDTATTPVGQAASTPASKNTIKGLAPYWRLDWQNNFGPNYLMVGAYGLVTSLYPTGFTGDTDKFNDSALDAQYERMFGSDSLTLRGTYIHEKKDLDATF